MPRLRFQTREEFLHGFGGREGCCAADAVLDALERCAAAYAPRVRAPSPATARPNERSES